VHNIDFDTGSADLWVTDESQHGGFNTGTDWFVDYGSGSVSGTIYRMLVQIGDTPYKGNVEVGVATTDHISSLGLSGVVGLSFPDLADFSTPLLTQLNVTEFTLVLTTDGTGSELGLNCNDPGDGYEWQYIDVAPAPSGMYYYWATHLNRMVVDGDNLFPAGTAKPVIFDSGTSGLAFPEATITRMVTKLANSSGSNAKCDGSGESLDCYCTDCAETQFPVITLGFTSSDGTPVVVELPPTSYISCYPNYYYYAPGAAPAQQVQSTDAPDPGEGQVCEIMMQPNNDQYLILGDAFLMAQKTYWNIETKTFGLACSTGEQGSCSTTSPATTSFFDAGFGDLLDEIPEKRSLVNAKQRKWEQNLQQKAPKTGTTSTKLRSAKRGKTTAKLSAAKAKATTATAATTATMLSLPAMHTGSSLSIPLMMVCASSMAVLQVLIMIHRRRTYAAVE
jgi:hypothetical protein